MESIYFEEQKKHCQNFYPKNPGDLSREIYKTLVNKRYRSGCLPAEKTEKLILEKIESKVVQNLPVGLLQFWGGCKNPNLPADSPELCEKAALDNLERLNGEITKIYKPGLRINICPGDRRVQIANRMPQEKTEKYVEALAKMAAGYKGLFGVIPVSKLYDEYKDELDFRFDQAQKNILPAIFGQPEFERLAHNAKKNIFTEDLGIEDDMEESGKTAATNYIICRIAEEEAKIFRKFDDCIRSSFIKYTSFYKKYLRSIDATVPNLDCILTFYTGKKGNITQPWQAIGKLESGKVLFLSQEKLITQTLSLNAAKG